MWQNTRVGEIFRLDHMSSIYCFLFSQSFSSKTCKYVTLIYWARHQLETWSESGVIKYQNHVIEYPRTDSSL